MSFWVALGLALAGAAPALADDYPEHELHSIVNFQAGSPMDILTRWYGARLSELAGKPVIVENKLGAQGAIATDYVARAKPDGYTFMITPASSTLAEVAFIFKRLGFDPVKHLDPVLLMAKSGLVVVVDAQESGQHHRGTDRGATQEARQRRLRRSHQHRHRCGRIVQSQNQASDQPGVLQGHLREPARSLRRADRLCGARSRRCVRADPRRQAQGACGHLGHAPRSACRTCRPCRKRDLRTTT